MLLNALKDKGIRYNIYYKGMFKKSKPIRVYEWVLIIIFNFFIRSYWREIRSCLLFHAFS